MSTLLSRVVADFETSLSGAVSVGDSSFTIQSVTDDDSVTLSDGIYCFTLDRDNSSAKEYIVGQLTNATKTVSSISSVSRQGALTSNFQKAHRIGTNVIISDHSALNAIVKILNGTGTLDSGSPIGYDSTATISGANMLATKAYVDSVVNGGTVTYDKQILSSQTAGETLAAGNIVYLKASDSRWWLADADVLATYDQVQLGVALGAGTAGNTISGGVQISGACSAFTGLTANTLYYLSSTAGGVSTSAGTPKISIGVATATTTISLDFKNYSRLTGAEKDALAGGGAFGTPSTSNKFMTETNGATKKFGGDGSDGALDTSGGTVDIDAASANVVIKNYTSINIATNNLTLSNPASTGTLLILRSQGAVTISASILLNGDGAAAATSAFNYFVDGSLTPVGVANSGNTGGAGGFSRPAHYTTAVWQLQEKLGYRALVGSGGGTVSSGATGGRGGGGLIIECAGAYNFTGTINTSGVVGGTDGSRGGAGGGSAGTVIVVYGSLTADSGTYTSTGGAGGAGGSGVSSGGAGGAASAQGNGGAGGDAAGNAGVAGGVGAGGGGGAATGAAAGGAAGSSMTAIRMANLYDN